MFLLFFHQLSPRVQMGTQMLFHYWSISPRNTRPISYRLDNIAGVVIRRGDHGLHDMFLKKHGYWRNISYYMNGLYREETRRDAKFEAIFVMSDDANVTRSILEYANPSSTGSDELFARRFLNSRHVLFNIYEHDNCRQSLTRFDLEQFVISVNFLLEYSNFIIQHRDSNIGRYLEEVTYGRKQLVTGIQSYSYVRGAPDSIA